MIYYAEYILKSFPPINNVKKSKILTVNRIINLKSEQTGNFFPFPSFVL